MSKIGDGDGHGLTFGTAPEPDPNRLDVKLAERYQEKHRKYHTLTHIFEMLALFGGREWPISLDETHAVLWAIWYHDAIYDPQKAGNEEESALLAEREMVALNVDGRTIDNVMRLVRSTAAHEPTQPDEQVLSDLDLAILGAEHERYKEYVRQVREEYSFVPDEIWASEKGRPHIVRSFLDREEIYFYLTEREQMARNNLSWELMQYEGHP
jgi:predicted metal-dependent HD superfamily phosphohydrolase